MKKIAVLTGAGISAQSGISTFRDSNGLWEQHNVMDVASIEGWYKNPKLVLDFYNARRQQLAQCQPNAAHIILHELESYFQIIIITQNVDDLHERALSSNIIHLHGELTKARSSADDSAVCDIGYGTINMGDKAADGSQMRPHIVWFGENVPLMEAAARAVAHSDIVVIIGTSMAVYPAAGLVNYKGQGAPVFYINPDDALPFPIPNLTIIKDTATSGTAKLRNILMEQYYN